VTVRPRSTCQTATVLSRGLAQVLLALGIAAATVLAPAGAAGAHSGVREVVPADGSVLAVPPRQVQVTFTQNVLENTARMKVTGPQGEVPVRVATAGPSVTGSLGQALTSGSFTVLWRVTSADGHPISGNFTFQVSAATTAPSPAPSPAPSSPPAPTPSAVASAAATPTTTDSGAARLLIGAGAVLAAAAGIGGLWARYRRSQP